MSSKLIVLNWYPVEINLSNMWKLHLCYLCRRPAFKHIQNRCLYSTSTMQLVKKTYFDCTSIGYNLGTQYVRFGNRKAVNISIGVVYRSSIDELEFLK